MKDPNSMYPPFENKGENWNSLELTEEELHRIAYILMIHAGTDDELANKIREHLQKEE